MQKKNHLLCIKVGPEQLVYKYRLVIDMIYRLCGVLNNRASTDFRKFVQLKI